VSTTLPTDEEVMRQLAEVRLRVMEATQTVRSPKRSTVFRRTRNLIVVGATGLALTAGGIFVSSTLVEREATAQCFAGASLNAPTAQALDLGIVQDDRTPAQPARFDPVAQCAHLWAIGEFEPGADPSKSEPIYPVPPLTACTLSNGVAAVFPNREEITAEKLCGTLGLAVWDPDSGV